MDNNIFDQDLHPHSNLGDFARTAGATLAGAYIGHKLDQTRFGYWFNTNPVVTFFWRLAGVAIGLFALYFVGFMGWYVLTH
jgi:hypothetical protein